MASGPSSVEDDLSDEIDETNPSDEGSLSNAAQSIELIYFSRFSDLTNDLRNSGIPIPRERVVLGFDYLAYEEKQRELDFALEAIWTRIESEIDFEGAPIPANAKAIREWLSNPINADKIAQITNLDLSRMNLTFLPVEIGAFSQLTRLDLSRNQLTTLPPEIGAFSQLTWLNLDQNHLTTLPPEISKFSRLEKLVLCENRLTTLPPEIGELSQLVELVLSKNHLTTLPPQIGNLSQLNWLDLRENRLTTLPPEIARLSKLTRLELDGNLFTFTLDGSLSEFGMIDSDYHSLIGKYFGCSGFMCKTPLASLCQKIHIGMGDSHHLKGAFNMLSDEMQQRICEAWTTIPSSSSSSSEAEIDLFADRASFVQAVITVLQGKWQSLSEEQRRQTYAQVSILAGQPEGDPSWGMVHARENIIRLIEAMELVTQK